jgi:hypothetical protein
MLFQNTLRVNSIWSTKKVSNAQNLSRQMQLHKKYWLTWRIQSNHQPKKFSCTISQSFCLLKDHWKGKWAALRKEWTITGKLTSLQLRLQELRSKIYQIKDANNSLIRPIVITLKDWKCRLVNRFVESFLMMRCNAISYFRFNVNNLSWQIKSDYYHQ